MFPHRVSLGLSYLQCIILTVIRVSTSSHQSGHRSLSRGCVFIKGQFVTRGPKSGDR